MLYAANRIEGEFEAFAFGDCAFIGMISGLSIVLPVFGETD